MPTQAPRDIVQMNADHRAWRDAVVAHELWLKEVLAEPAPELRRGEIFERCQQLREMLDKFMSHFEPR